MNGFKSFDHGEEDGRIDVRLVAEAKVEDRGRPTSEAHA